MNIQFQKTKVIAGISTILLVTSLIFSGNYYFENKGLHKENRSEKLKSEKLLSEKLLLDKEISGLRGNITSLMGKNKDLDNYLNDANAKLDQKEAEISRLTKENKKVKSLQKELNDIKKIRIELNKQISEMNDIINQLRNENDGLANQIQYLQAENQSLHARIVKMNNNKAGNFLVEVTKSRKDKLTARAKQTDKITVSFDVPEMITAGKKNVYMVIVDPKGNAIENEKIAKTTLNFEGNTKTIVPCAMKEIKNVRRASMSYEADENHGPGIYKIEIYSEDAYLGGAEVKLRK